MVGRGLEGEHAAGDVEGIGVGARHRPLDRVALRIARGVGFDSAGRVLRKRDRRPAAGDRRSPVLLLDPDGDEQLAPMRHLSANLRSHGEEVDVVSAGFGFERRRLLETQDAARAYLEFVVIEAAADLHADDGPGDVGGRTLRIGRRIGPERQSRRAGIDLREGRPAYDRQLVYIRHRHGDIARVGARAVSGVDRHVVDVVGAAVALGLEVGRGFEAEHAAARDLKQVGVVARQAPGDRVAVGVGRAVGPDHAGRVLDEAGRLRPAADARRVVGAGHDHVDRQRVEQAPVRGLDDHEIEVFRVGVRRGVERQRAARTDAEIAGVLAGHRPGNARARIGVGRGVGRHGRRAVGDLDLHVAGHDRRLVDVGHEHADDLAHGVDAVRGRDRQVVLVVFADIGLVLEVEVLDQPQLAVVTDPEVLGVRARDAPVDGVAIGVRRRERLDVRCAADRSDSLVLRVRTRLGDRRRRVVGAARDDRDRQRLRDRLTAGARLDRDVVRACCRRRALIGQVAAVVDGEQAGVRALHRERDRSGLVVAADVGGDGARAADLVLRRRRAVQPRLLEEPADPDVDLADGGAGAVVHLDQNLVDAVQVRINRVLVVEDDLREQLIIRPERVLPFEQVAVRSGEHNAEVAVRLAGLADGEGLV